MTTSLRLDAPAKLNLSLAVTRRRPDGFHELTSVMVLLELADRLLLMSGCSGLRLEGRTDDVPTEPDRNLAWRGLLAGLGGEPDLACLTVDKRVPAAAGLGGGSSDAAAAWRLGRRWSDPGGDDHATTEELAHLLQVGADVPFFAAAVSAARVTGIGELVEPIPAADPPQHVVLAHPTFGLSTAAVFAELRRNEWSAADTADAARAAVLGPGRNDLLPAALRLRPELETLMALVTAAGGEPHMTGSGPTLFVATDDPERAAAIAGRLKRGGVRTTRTRTRETAASIEALAEEK
ncbi:MAG: 4-(cytidine 5'-diphospho)-2-C-methyl-D-erythritol kinase [Candidatus Limnocylindria bacterium]